MRSRGPPLGSRGVETIDGDDSADESIIVPCIVGAERLAAAILITKARSQLIFASGPPRVRLRARTTPRRRKKNWRQKLCRSEVKRHSKLHYMRSISIKIRLTQPSACFVWSKLNNRRKFSRPDNSHLAFVFAFVCASAALLSSAPHFLRAIILFHLLLLINCSLATANANILFSSPYSMVAASIMSEPEQ